MGSNSINVGSTAGPLGRWYADPLTTDEAGELLTAMDLRLARQYRRGGRTIGARLTRMVARYWLGLPIAEEYAFISALGRHSPHARALIELVYGQLLLTRREAKAWPHLERGFAEARPLLSAADYFVVLNRHQLLRTLPTGPAPQAAQSLEDLITVARVTARLGRGAPRKPVIANPHDTLG